MLFNIKRTLRFTGRLISMPILKQQQQQASTLSNTYHSIHDTTLDKFIACICDHNYSVLNLPGEKNSDAILRAAWDNIYSEYIDCVKDTEQIYISKLSKDINVLTTKLNLIALVVERLSIKHDADIVAELRKVISVPGDFNPANRDAYKKDLERVVSLSKTLYMQREEKRAEMSRLMPMEGTGKIDHSHFDALIVQISKYMKFQINRRQIFVGEFVAMMIDLRGAVKAAKTKTTKK